MESKMKIKIRIVESLWLLVMAFFVVSCAKGFDDSETFSGGVTNTQLESPKDISFTTTTNADGSENLKLTWSVVMGAGGYKVNVFNMNDPVNPVAVVTDSIIDGSSMSFAKMEDTNYRASILTIGNEKLNNTSAQTATEKDYKAFEAVATIHANESLADYVNNEMQDFPQNQEQCIVLEPGVTYNLDDVADFRLNTVTLRGDEENHPVIKVGASGGLVTQGGLKMKNIDIDCTDMTQLGVVTLSETQDASVNVVSLGYQGESLDKNCYVINNPIILQGCNLKNVKNSIVYDSNKKWGVRDFRIMDCIVQLNNEGSKAVINVAGGGGIKDMTIKNSTFYNLPVKGSAPFIKYSNTQPKKIWGDSDRTGSITLTNNTFSRTMASYKFADRVPNADIMTVNFSYNIFYDVYQMYQAVITNAARTTVGNTVFGVTKETHENDTGRTDSNGRPVATLEDPNFEGPIDSEFDFTKVNGGVNFTPRGSIAVENKSGDPRWYE